MRHFAGCGFHTDVEQNVWHPTDFDHDMGNIPFESLNKQLDLVIHPLTATLLA